MTTRTDDAKGAILRAMQEVDGPVGAARISRVLDTAGIRLQPRTVRFYLLQLDQEGLTRYVSRRRGRELTERGREELSHANVLGKVGFVAAKVGVLGYRMSYNVRDARGTLISNVAMVKKQDLSRAVLRMRPVFKEQLGMGVRCALARSGQTFAGRMVPRGMVGLGTVCSVTVNGIMLKEGIAVQSRFGGLLEMRDGRPIRFVELIEYSGSTIDPLEVFIQAGMTQVLECAETGSGIVGASFREVPAPAIADVNRVRKAMTALGLGGILSVGRPNLPLLDIPVAGGRAGMIVMGGLNPIAALHEAGIPVDIQSLAGLEPSTSFAVFEEIALRGRRRSPYVD